MGLARVAICTCGPTQFFCLPGDFVDARKAIFRAHDEIAPRPKGILPRAARFPLHPGTMREQWQSVQLAAGALLPRAHEVFLAPETRALIVQRIAKIQDFL
jgi:hypothetical protein